MKAWASVLVAAAGLWLASPAAAQLPERGARSLRLSPNGDTQVGAWKMVSERASLGLDVGVALSRGGVSGDEDGDRTTLGLTVAPSLKRYGAPLGRFAPYLFGSLPLGLQRAGRGDDADQDGWTVGGALAAGLDWFPVRGVSLGAHAGLQASYMSRSFGGAAGQPDVEDATSIFGTFGSGMGLHIYF